MNSPRNIWSDRPLSEGIATFVCYAGVFNDVIGIDEMASRLGVSGRDEFQAALTELQRQGRLVLRDGFAGLPHLEEKIALKASKIATAHRLIDSCLSRLKRLGRNPLVRFVGVSGSLAADNPTADRHNHLDVDVFLITRRQCLWLYSILRGLRCLLPRRRREPELCINYVMDESNLLVATRNFYTATEIRNLIPISGFGAYRRFLQVNNWADYYYPGVSAHSAPEAVRPSRHLVNKAFYVLYTLLRCVKRLSLEPLATISFKPDPHRGIGFNVRSPAAYGGYQAMVQKKFSRLVAAWFPELLDAGLIERLFPDELSAEIRRGDIDEATVILGAGLGPDYSKYG